MPSWLPILGAVLAVFAVVGAGAALRRLDWLTEEADRSLLALIVRLLMPCLVLQTTLRNDALLRPANLGWPLLLVLGTVVLGLAVAALVARSFGRRFGLVTAKQRRTFTLCVGIYNYGYIPIPLVAALWPTDAGTLGVLLVFNVAVEFALWTLGVLALTGGVSASPARGAEAAVPWWRRALNPPSLAVAAALVLNALHAPDHLPPLVADPLWKVLGWLGQCAIPLSLLLVGATLADNLRGGGEARLHEGHGVTLVACVLRLLLLPAAFVLLARFLPITLELRRVLVIQAAMPAAMFPIVMSKYYDGDPPTALRVVLGTSLAGLVTIPLWVTLGLALLR
jgi:malate permease and related proteins